MSEFTLLFSRNRDSSAEQRRFEEELLARLGKRFASRTFVLPHIYDLKNSSPALDTLRQQGGPWIVLSWMYPRAAYWTLRAFGIEGTQIESGTPTPIRNGTRTIECVNLADFADASQAEAGVESILRDRGLFDEAVAEPDGIHVFEESTIPRWYPVVDRDRCGNCLECLNFCLFGVYSVDENESLFVEIPDACRNGCPACSRVCPQGAIMFPAHADPAIAGGTAFGPKESEDAGSDALEQAASEQAAATQVISLDTLVDELDEFEG